MKIGGGKLPKIESTPETSLSNQISHGIYCILGEIRDILKNATDQILSRDDI